MHTFPTGKLAEFPAGVFAGDSVGGAGSTDGPAAGYGGLGRTPWNKISLMDMTWGGMKEGERGVGWRRGAGT